MVRRGLQALLTTMGVVATVAGADGVVRGASAVGAGGSVPADVDSEFRFFAAWYASAGLLLLQAARAPERATTVVRASCGGLLLGAAGRALSIRRLGPPRLLFRILLGIEVALPVVTLAWLHRVVRDARPAPIQREGTAPV